MVSNTFRHRASRFGAITTTAVLCAVATIVAPAGAWAVGDSTADATAAVSADSLAGLEAVDDSLVIAPVEDGGLGEVALGEGTVDVPTSLDEPVTLSSDAAEEFEVSLPADQSTQGASVQDDGTVTYPGKEFASSVIVGDAGVQMLTTIVGPAAPTSYSYDVSLKPGQTLELINEGAAVVNADGTIDVAVGNAWAKDANGADVATHYEVQGATLIQVVDHTADANVAYPVVADPIWLAPWVVRCLIGIGINGPTITRIASSGSPAAILAAFGYGAFRCVIGR